MDWIQHRDTVQTVQFDPTDRRLVTRDQTGFRLCETETGEAIRVHYASPVTGGVGLNSPTMCDTFSSDGRRVFPAAFGSKDYYEVRVKRYLAELH